MVRVDIPTSSEVNSEYFSWKNNKEVIEKRMSNLGQYLTEEGLALSQDMVRVDIPTSSEVNSVKF